MGFGNAWRNVQQGKSIGIVQSPNDIYGGLTGTNAANDNNARNLQFQREKLRWDQQTQQRIFDREDNSVFRRKQDLLRSGLSPTLAAGDGAGAGAVVPTQAPQGQYTPNNALEGLMKIYSMYQMGVDISKTEADIAKVISEKKGIDYDNVPKEARAKVVKDSGTPGDSWPGKVYNDVHGAVQTWWDKYKSTTREWDNKIKGVFTNPKNSKPAGSAVIPKINRDIKAARDAADIQQKKATREAGGFR